MKRLVERAMEVELTDHLGYEPHLEPPGGAGNANTAKTLITEHGLVIWLASTAARDQSLSSDLPR